MTIQEFHTGFRQHFPDLGTPSQFIDETMLIARIVALDVIKLDHALRVPDGQSTADVVLSRYGKLAVAWVRRAL